MTDFYTEVWFWLIVIGIILLIVGLILYVTQRNVEWYHWLLWLVGGFFLLVGIIWAIGYANRDETPAGYTKVEGTQHYVDAAGNNVFIDGRSLEEGAVPLPKFNTGKTVVASPCANSVEDFESTHERYCPPRLQNKCAKDLRNAARSVAKGTTVVASPTAVNYTPVASPVPAVNYTPVASPVPAVNYTPVASPVPAVNYTPVASPVPVVPTNMRSPVLRPGTIATQYAPVASPVPAVPTNIRSPVLRPGTTATQYAPGVPIPGVSTNLKPESNVFGGSVLGAAPVLQ